MWPKTQVAWPARGFRTGMSRKVSHLRAQSGLGGFGGLFLLRPDRRGICCHCRWQLCLKVPKASGEPHPSDHRHDAGGQPLSARVIWHRFSTALSQLLRAEEGGGNAPGVTLRHAWVAVTAWRGAGGHGSPPSSEHTSQAARTLER